MRKQAGSKTQKAVKCKKHEEFSVSASFKMNFGLSTIVILNVVQLIVTLINNLP